MTSETDAAFVERMAQIYGPYKLTREPQLAHLIALARRGAEAAARIERLEAALRKIASNNQQRSNCFCGACIQARAARAALGEKA